MPSPSPLESVVLDHVAVAVDDLDAAVAHWRALGATAVSGSEHRTFHTEQLRLGNGGKIELIGAPAGATSFITDYLQRFGSGRVHHVTLKVPGPLSAAVQTLAAHGYAVVDHSEANPHWHEAFLSPRLVGGLIVQLAWSPNDDAAYAAQMGRPAPQPINPSAPHLQGVRLRHPDVAAAAALWTALGADLAHPDGPQQGFVATFPDSPVAVEVVEGETAGPAGLIMPGLDPEPATDLRPAVLAR